MESSCWVHSNCIAVPEPLFTKSIKFMLLFESCDPYEYFFYSILSIFNFPIVWERSMYKGRWDLQKSMAPALPHLLWRFNLPSNQGGRPGVKVSKESPREWPQWQTQFAIKYPQDNFFINSLKNRPKKCDISRDKKEISILKFVNGYSCMYFLVP